MQQQRGNYRWTICALLFFATTINYLDRSVISLLKPILASQFKWTESDYSHIVMAFQLSYAVGMIYAGRFIDRVGTKAGYSLATLLWSVAAMGHALVQSTFGFGIARAALGLSESGNFPAAIKTTTEWFPKKERAFATGLFNSGATVGAIVAPLTVPWIAKVMGWQWAFLLTGAIGFIWLILWVFVYEIPARNRRLSPAELEYINGDMKEPSREEDKAQPVSWWRLISFRQTWAFVIGKFLTDPVWWFFLFWLPAFLDAQYKVKDTAIAWPVALVYVMATLGSTWGGYLPLWLINRGWSVFRARKTSMLLYAVCVIPVIFAQWLGSLNMWLAVIIIGCAMAAHQAWSANIFTTVSDMFPKKAVASVTGIGGMMGSLGGVLIAWGAGILFDKYKLAGHLKTGYYIMFFICGFAYLLAWLIMHFLVPKPKTVVI